MKLPPIHGRDRPAPEPQADQDLQRFDSARLQAQQQQKQHRPAAADVPPASGQLSPPPQQPAPQQLPQQQPYPQQNPYGYAPQPPGYPPQMQPPGPMPPGPIPPVPMPPGPYQQNPYGQQHPYGPQQPYGQQPQQPYNAYGQYGYQPPPNPLHMQLQQQMAQAQALMQQHERENRFIQQLQQGTAPATDTQVTGDDPTMAGPASSPAMTEAERQHEEMMAEHRRQMEQMKWKMEQLQTEQQLETLMGQAEKVRRERELERQAEQMQNQIREAKLRKQLAKEMPNNVLAAQAQQHVDPTVYDPVRGFTVFIDFVFGLPSKAIQSSLVYGVYDGNAPAIPAKMLALVDTDDAAVAGKTCVFATKRTFKNMPAGKGLKMVFEPQVATSVASDPTARAATKAVGWTTVHLFNAAKDGGDMRLNAGQFHLPIFRPPVQPTLTCANMRDKPKVAKTGVFIRIVSNHILNQEVKDGHERFGINPPTTNVNYYNMYVEGSLDTPPDIKQRAPAPEPVMDEPEAEPMPEEVGPPQG